MELARQRSAFVKQTAHELGVKEETIHREVGRLLTALGDPSPSASARLVPSQTVRMPVPGIRFVKDSLHTFYVCYRSRHCWIIPV